MKMLLIRVARLVIGQVMSFYQSEPANFKPAVNQIVVLQSLGSRDNEAARMAASQICKR